MTEELCPCGQPLHYSNPSGKAIVESIIRTMGPDLTITVPDLGSWKVPRHYIALHGVKAADIPTLAAKYGWEAA